MFLIATTTERPRLEHSKLRSDCLVLETPLQAARGTSSPDRYEVGWTAGDTLLQPVQLTQ